MSSKEWYQEYYQKNKEKKKAATREWVKQNPDHKKAMDKHYRLNNPDKVYKYSKEARARSPEKARLASALHRKKYPERALWSSAKRRAAELNLPFNLEPFDCIAPTHCPILNIPLFRGVGGKMIDNSPTLDKFIPELGYVKGNVQVISAKANRIKSDATAHEVRKVAEWMESRVGS